MLTLEQAGGKYLDSSDLTRGTEVHMAASDTQFLYGSPTHWAGLLFHAWTHCRRVASLISIEVKELVLSAEPESLA